MKTPQLLIIALALSTMGVAIAQQSAPAGERPAMRQRMSDHLKAADTDKDGVLSKAEVEKAMPQFAAHHFDQLDANKDGKLSADELKAMQDKMGGRHHGGRSGHDGHGAFGGADANGDKVLTRDEVIAHHQKMLQDFDAADANKDGKLGADEMKALHDKMRAQRPPRGTPPAAK